MKNIDTNSKRIVCIACFFIVFFSSDTILFGTNENGRFLILGFIIEAFIVALIFFYYGIKNGFYIKAKATIVMLSYITCVVLSALLNSDYRGGYLVIILMISLGFLWVNAIPIEVFARSYVKIFRFIAACSVFGKLLIDLVPVIGKIGMPVNNYLGVKFVHFIFYAQKVSQGEAYRNFSFFREPGALQFYLIAAILVNLIVFNKKEKLKEWIGIIIMVVATLMTSSTTAYYSLIILFVFYYIREKKYQRILKNPGFIFLELAVVVLIILVLNYYTNDGLVDKIMRLLFNKFDDSSIYYSSGVTRVASISTNLELWVKRPFFGVGISTKELLYNDLASAKYNWTIACDTNTILSVFSRFGLMAGIITITGIIGLSYSFKARNMERLLVVLIIIIQLFSQDYYLCLPYYIWIWYGIIRVFSYSKRNERCKLLYNT